MPKLLLEYNGIPFIYEHGLKKIDKKSFVVVYKTGNWSYEEKSFATVDEAVGFNTGSELKLVFLYLESFEEEMTYVEYAWLNFPKKSFTNKIEKVINWNRITIEFDLNYFKIQKQKKGFNKDEDRMHFNFSYTRRKAVLKNNKEEFEYVDSYFELVPRFENIFLETIFFLDVVQSHLNVQTRDGIEPFFLQAKQKIEGKASLSFSSVNEQVQGIINHSEEALALDRLVGLKKVKLEIEELRMLAQMRRKRQMAGLPVTPSTLHLVFTGNPGTGKTTVARLLGQIYHDMGLLAENKVVEVSRTDLVGEYVGHTAPKTTEVFNKALGGVLFIDEAYSLFKSGTDFGGEAVETLMKLMEDNREKIVVILAGYPDEMQSLVSSNPGLKSRFSKFLHFEDYTPTQLVEIFCKMVTDYSNTLTEGAKYKLEHLVETCYDSGYFSSNARSVRNLFEEVVRRQSARLSRIESPTQEEMITFTDKDLPDHLS